MAQDEAPQRYGAAGVCRHCEEHVAAGQDNDHVMTDPQALKISSPNPNSEDFVRF